MKALDISKEELIAAVRKIDDRLALLWSPLDLTKSAMNVGNIGFVNRSSYFTNVYSFDENKWFDEGSKLLSKSQKCLLNKFIDRIRNIKNNNQSQEINICGNNKVIKTVKSNPFKDYTNHLADALHSKNSIIDLSGVKDKKVLMMTIKEFYDRLYKINKNLTVVRKTVPVRIFFSDYTGNADIYDFETGEYNLPSCDKYLSNDMEDVADLIDTYNYESKYEDRVNNPFRSYTENLAETLQEKNKAYGDSFSQSVDDYGLKVIGIRLSDKYNRIKHLVNNGELKENDESLADTLLDMAGYSILGLKYLKEHKN